ncbi:calpastatin isoform X42 [Gymnodraco acuticeps]|uniref:Calpastatin n=1 Tax=Gymnodraco acuticeps TaxID=8218 RepID=A0A6P8X6A3_GYMAC|nr:calpastatin isoform X42 [Gymnodraco acuticeps]
MAYAAYWMSLKGEAPASPQIHHSGRSSNSYSTAGSYYGKSQPSRATPKLATQVSTGKPAQFEKAASGSAMPGVTTATGGATRSGMTAGGSASVGTAGKAKAETNTMAATVIDMSSAGSTFVDMTSAGARAAPKEMPKTAAVSQVKATVTSPAAGFTAVTKPKESPKGSAKSATATTTVKAEVPKVDTARPSKPTATAGNVSVQGKKEVTEIKVQAEIPPAAAKGAKEVDPFDALANILPSVGPAPVLPVYTGPEVVEHNIISETGLKCGERDSTLPPGYRFDDMPPVPADYKPKDVPKPLSTDEALDSLSFGFTSPAAPAAPKKQEVMTEMSATVPTVSVCPPPADKKAKMEKDDFSLESCLPAATATKAAPPVSSWKAPPADKTTKKVDTKPKTDGGDSMSLDALSALVDTLPEDLPKPDLPELRPEDIISEGKHKKEKGVFVGERDDSIAPEYRFKKEDLKKVPALKPEPALGTADALDFLSGDFMDSSSAPPAQKAPVVAVCPPANKFMQEKIPDDFSLEAATATKVESNFAVCRGPPAGKKAEVEKTAAGKDKLKSGQGDSFSLDALSALSDTLPADMPKPELPEVRPEDIVSEGKHKKEKGVFVGEREDSIAPGYRFNKEEHKKLPVPKPEPTMGTADALDFLSGGFSDSSSAPPAQTKVEDLSALDMLSEDFVSTTKASGVQAPAPPATKKKTPERTVCPLERPNKVDVIHVQPREPKPKTDKGDSFSLDALSALSDTLPKDLPKPELSKLRPEDIISEDKHKKEKGVFVGERDDSIPPEYRFNEEESKKRPAPKPEPSINTGDALDFLSGDFAFSSSAPVVQAPVITPSAPPAQPSADFALDALAEEFVSSRAASTVKSSACAPTESSADLAAGADNALEALDALDALSDTLKDITPVPMPAPVPTKDLVNEEKLKEERLIKMGERDDTLPPEYRPTGDIGKVPAQPKPKGKSMDDKTALDLLSSDFSAAASLPVAPVASGAATTKLEPPVLDSEPLKPMAGAVLDTLSSTLLPDAPEFIPKSDKPKGKSKSKSKSKKHHAEEPHSDQLPAPPSSDVVPKSTRKGGRS